MDIFRSRYFFIACILSMIISVVSFFVLPIVKLIIAMSAIVFSMAVMLYYALKRSNKSVVILSIIFCLAIFMASFSSYIAFDAIYSAEKAIDGNEVEISAVVLSEEYNSGNVSGYSIKVEKVNGENKSYLAMLECSYISEVKPGDRIIANVIASAFEENVKGYAEKMTRLSDGYILAFESLSEDTYEIIEHGVKNATVFFAKLNFDLSYKLRDAIGGEEGNLAAAMLLGSKSNLSDVTVRDYRRSGASHYLALSGLHMSIIMGAISLVLWVVRVPKIPRAILLIIASLFYLALTGMSISTVRSVIMLMWVYLSMILSYRSDTLTNLSFAGAAILVFSPFAVIDSAFWMSFAATFGIVVFMQIFKDIFDKVDSDYKLVRIVKKAGVAVIGLFATALCAFIGLVLVMCIFNKEYALYTMLTSVALSIPSAGIILFSLLLPVFSSIPAMRAFLISAIQRFGEFSIDLCADISRKKNVVYSINYDFLIYFAIAFAVVLIISLLIKLSRKYMVFFMYAPVIIAFIFAVNVTNANNAANVDITYFNTSSRSDIFVMANDRTAIICDLSNGSSSAFSYALEQVDKSRATEIEAIMLTDYHTAHISTLSRIFKSNMVRQLWLPTPSDDDAYYKMLAILEVALENNVKTRMYDVGENIYAFGEVKINLQQSYIKRSTVPISILNIECNEDILTYFSPSYIECDMADEFESIIDGSDYVILGTRGPKVKKYFSLGGGEDIREILIPDEDTGIYLYTGDIPRETKILFGCKNKTYTFTRELND